MSFCRLLGTSMSDSVCIFVCLSLRLSPCMSNSLSQSLPSLSYPFPSLSLCLHSIPVWSQGGSTERGFQSEAVGHAPSPADHSAGRLLASLDRELAAGEREFSRTLGGREVGREGGREGSEERREGGRVGGE